MKNSKLSEHNFKKGKFSTEFGEFIKQHGKENSWFLDRLPEYMWLLLIIRHFGRQEGMERCAKIFKSIQQLAPQLATPKISTLLSIDENTQQAIYNSVIEVATTEVISPLTIILTQSKYPCFANSFHVSDFSVEDRMEAMLDILKEAGDHQSSISTDIRFLIIYYEMSKGQLMMPRKTAELIMKYPFLSHDDKEMRLIRPMIRSMEIAQPNDDKDEEYLFLFWEGMSKMDDCHLVYAKIKETEKETEKYMDALEKIMAYYTSVLETTLILDNKLTVLIGITTYAYKRMIELVEHNLFNTISGRGIVRVIIESFIIMKYLIKEEPNHKDIWTEYQYYGIGQYKLIAERILESEKDVSQSHVNVRYIDLLVQEYVDKEFIEMDTTYFDKKNVREKAISVGEKKLFGFYYDYDSAFEHGLWGAIRESAMLKCTSPAHQYHCVPDIEDNQKLPCVWNDCRMVMNKIISILKETYGLPDHLYDEVLEYGS